MIYFFAVAYLDFEPLGQGVDDRRADAVQTARDLVCAAAEFAAGVEHREDDGDGRDTLLRMDTDGDSAAVIAHFDHVAGQDRHFDMRAEARHSLVDGVIDDLVDEMVKSARTR